MKTRLLLAALTVGSWPVTADEPAPAASGALTPVTEEATQKEAIPFTVVESKAWEEGGRRVALQRVRPPLLPDRPAAVPLTAERREEIRRTRPYAFWRTRLIWVDAVKHPDGRFYMEWRPPGGGERYGAWSRADLSLFQGAPEMADAATETRWLLLVTLRAPRRFPAPYAETALTAPEVPADGTGFVVVKGDAANAAGLEPVTKLHEFHATRKPELLARQQERERLRQAALSAGPAPPLPPKDTVIRYWPNKSRRHGSGTAEPKNNP